MSLLVGVPVILPPRPEVVASWNHRPHLIVINGANDEWHQIVVDADDPINETRWPERKNAGVAAAWNNICARAERTFGVSHVALLSQGTIIEGGTERLADAVDEFADWRGLLTDAAWHCIVLSVALWKHVGPFDEIFWPAYYEDQSYVRRLELAGYHTASNPIPKVGRDELGFTEESFAATLKAGVIDPDCYAKNGERYRQMWGGDPREETFVTPYDLPLPMREGIHAP